MFAIFREVTPLVEPLSLDEAYLDVTENAWGETLATPVAKRLKERIRAETGLTASAGVAPNKFLAKIASGWKKPDGLTVISPDRVEPFLQQLPVDALWGVGPVTARKLRARGIERLVDVRTPIRTALRETVGSLADWLQQLAERHRRSAGRGRTAKRSRRASENTYPEDLTDLGHDSRPRSAKWRATRSAGSSGVSSWRVRSRSRFVTVISRRLRGAIRPRPRATSRRLSPARVRLLEKTDAGRRPVRLLGVSVHNFSGGQAIGSDGDRLPFGESLGRDVATPPESDVTDTWSPTQYEKFRTEREQPFADLLSLIHPAPSMRIVDLGCGTGRLTRRLHTQLNARETIGIDRSPRMLEVAQSEGELPGLQFAVGDIAQFSATGTFNVVFSNAAFHWVEDHAALVERLTASLAPGGQLVFQVPASHEDPSHTVADELATVAPFAAGFNGWRRPQPVLTPEAYARLLYQSGFTEQHVRLVIYPHVLDSREDVIEWMKGTLLTEYQRHLPAELFPAFMDAYRARLLPRLESARPFFFPFKRILCWGRRK